MNALSTEDKICDKNKNVIYSIHDITENFYIAQFIPFSLLRQRIKKNLKVNKSALVCVLLFLKSFFQRSS